MKNDEKIEADFSQEKDLYEKIAYTIDMNDRQAFLDLFKVEPKLTKEEKEFNAKLVMFEQMAPVMSEEEALATSKAIQKYYEAEKNGKILDDDLPF